MDSYLQSNLNSNLTFKNEVNSIAAVQVGNKYYFILELDSPIGAYYCPVKGYKTKEAAIRAIREGSI